MAWANNDSIALQSEKMPIFQGCGGGMMVHAGYLFGQPAGATLPTGESISMQGMTYGLGGSMRVHLWKHLRVGMEGFSWLTPDTPDEMCMPAYSSLVGTLLLGASYRASHPIMKPTSNSLIKILKGKLEEKALTLFTDQEGEQEHNV